MAKKPPPAPVVPAAGASQSLTNDPYNLDISGYGALSGQVIQGANEFFGLPTSLPSKVQGPLPVNKKNQGPYLPTQLPPLTATQTIAAFTHLTGAKLAQIQDQLYRGGYYSASYVPKYGMLHAEDVSAFRNMMIGLASNPSQATLNDYLNQSATTGGTKRSPLVIKLANPDDLRITLQKTAQDLYGGNLDDNQVNQFIQTFQSLQATEQTQAYQAGGFNPETGQSDLTGSPSAGGTVIAAPSAGAEAETYIRKTAPNQVAATQFGNAMAQIMSTLKNPAA